MSHALKPSGVCVTPGGHTKNISFCSYRSIFLILLRRLMPRVNWTKNLKLWMQDALLLQTICSQSTYSLHRLLWKWPVHEQTAALCGALLIAEGSMKITEIQAHSAVLDKGPKQNALQGSNLFSCISLYI